MIADTENENREHIHKVIHCRFTSDTLFLLLLIGLVLNMQHTMTTYHNASWMQRERILDQGHQNEVMLANHIKTAVERWDKLRRDNPSIETPNIPEPPRP